MQVRVAASDPARAAVDVLVLPTFELDPKKWQLPARVGEFAR